MAAGDRPAMDRAANHAAAAPRFVERYGRAPRPPRDSAATINDLIFARMIEPDWSPLARALVDKSTAKQAVARLCPALRSPETVATFAMNDAVSVDDLRIMLAPFVGSDAIAKPTQASGGTLFLKDGLDEGGLQKLHELATSNYALVMREMQYAGLPHRVIVEKLVPATGSAPPDDFKFHCVYGTPLLCQIDHARFGNRWSRVFRVPGFEPMYPADGLILPPSVVWPTPDRLRAMTRAASTLARDFDYVRVDFYNGTDGIYFGEMTFTPAASLGIAPSAQGCTYVTDTHREYSRTLMQAFRQGPARSRAASGGDAGA